MGQVWTESGRQADRLTERMTDEERQKDGEDILRENGETERGNGGREGIWDGEKKEADRQTWAKGDREGNNFSSLGGERVGWVTPRNDTYP